MPEANIPKPEVVDWHAERRAEIEADQGRANTFMARAEVTGTFDESAVIATAVRAGHAAPKAPKGLHQGGPAHIERGTPSGTDVSLRIMKEEAEASKDAPPPTPEQEARAEAAIRALHRTFAIKKYDAMVAEANGDPVKLMKLVDANYENWLKKNDHEEWLKPRSERTAI